MTDFLFRGSLADLDPAVHELTQIEAERQVRKLILIASESTAPQAVREALMSTFQNLYAEGYPDEDTRWMSEAEILDYPARLAYFRRYADPRYYKGVEYVDHLEALARRRCAELFATEKVSADNIYVNVQALSGAPANNAVYHALVTPGETIMGMNLMHGGHLSHGSPVNRSGKYYNAVHYTVDPVTEQINYDAVEELARQHKPKFIIAGYSSYPWAVDWARFRAIADAVGAYLFADIAHVAGLVAGGVYPSPVGYAHVITFTTHKSLCGPRGACILTTDGALARKIDGVAFQGGEAKDFPLVLGEGRTLPEFEGGLTGMKAGETKSFDVTFPADYFAKELAGKTATFEATMKSVHAPHLPEVDDAFARTLGINEGGAAKLKEEIAANLAREAKRRIHTRVKEQIMDGLLAVTPFEVPKGLVAAETRSLMEHAVSDLKARGMKEQDIKLGEQVFEPQARRRVALSLLLNSFAAANKVTADEDKVRAKVDEFAQSYEDPTEVVAWYYQDANRLRDVRAMVVEDNVVEMVLQQAQVTDEPTTLENLMGKA